MESAASSKRVLTCSTSSMFLKKLPLEIRSLIYNHYFFASQESCRVFQPSWPDTGDDTTSLPTTRAYPVTCPFRTNITALPLMLTCRQIYVEAVTVLYSKADFHFNDLAVLKLFLQRVSAAQKDLIRTIHLEWASFVWFHIGCPAVRGTYLSEQWQPVCKMLSGMRDLRNLRISTRPPGKGTRGRGALDMAYLEPLRTIKARNFVFEI